MKNIFFVFCFSVISTGCSSVDVELQDYFSGNMFVCIYDNPVSFSEVTTIYDKDGTYMGVQKVKASRIGESTTMRMTVKFNGYWHVDGDYLNTELKGYQMEADNPSGEELVELMKEPAESIKKEFSTKIKVESVTSYLEIKDGYTNSCQKV